MSLCYFPSLIKNKLFKKHYIIRKEWKREGIKANKESFLILYSMHPVKITVATHAVENIHTRSASRCEIWRCGGQGRVMTRKKTSMPPRNNVTWREWDGRRVANLRGWLTGKPRCAISRTPSFLRVASDKPPVLVHCTKYI